MGLVSLPLDDSFVTLLRFGKVLGVGFGDF